MQPITETPNAARPIFATRHQFYAFVNALTLPESLDGAIRLLRAGERGNQTIHQFSPDCLKRAVRAVQRRGLELGFAFDKNGHWYDPR